MIKSRLKWRPLAWSGLAVLGVNPVWAVGYVLGPADSLAIDQPRITFGLTDETDPLNPVLIGPTLQNLALLDTGANGVLLGSLSFSDGENYSHAVFPFDYDNSGAIDPDEQNAFYAELGVAGTSLLEVYEPHGLRVLDSVGNELLIDENFITFGDPSLNLGSFAAIVGMPAMAGRVVEIDMRPTLTLDFQQVVMRDQLVQAPFESAASLMVDLQILPPEYTDTTLPLAMRPTFAGLPMIPNTTMEHTGGALSGGATLSTSNTYLLDTGAQTTIISQAMADAMGIDYNNFITAGGDKIDELPVGGIGGEVTMPLVVIDELRLPTTDGVDLIFTNVTTGVLDIAGAPFDAVFGMNMLSSGYLGALFGGGGGDALTNPGVDEETLDLFIDTGTVTSVQDMFDFGIITLTQEDFDELVDLGLLTNPTDPRVVFLELRTFEEELGSTATGAFFDKVVFDFTATDGTGQMRLDLASISQIADANYDGVVDASDLAALQTHLGQSVRLGDRVSGDLNTDGVVDLADFGILAFNFGTSTPANAAVPEPASGVLVLLGAALIARRRR